MYVPAGALHMQRQPTVTRRNLSDIAITYILYPYGTSYKSDKYTEVYSHKSNSNNSNNHIFIAPYASYRGAEVVHVEV